MNSDLEMISDRPSLVYSSRTWSIVALVVTLSLGSGLVFWAHRMIEEGRRAGELAERYFAWSASLRMEEPGNPVKAQYVHELIGYYEHLGRQYAAAHRQPWIGVELLIDPPDRPASMPGRIDPVTGIPPEVAEAIASFPGSFAGINPTLRKLAAGF